jgi:serine/threonine protein kinase
MILQAGDRLGPYQIVSRIGAGGMGEVYKARDMRLDRLVAVKVLPAEFSEDARFHTRLEREAKAVAALNDPHICSVYDVGPNYFVMEFCEGKTLAERIAEGGLPIHLAIDYGIQLAKALERAHRSGVIHWA